MATFDAMSKLWTEENKVKVACKYCGRKMFLIPKKGYAICDWCGHRVNSKRTEFKEKLLNILKKEEVIK